MNGAWEEDEREELERSIQGHLCTLRIAIDQPDLKPEDLRMIDRKLGEIAASGSVSGLVDRVYRGIRQVR